TRTTAGVRDDPCPEFCVPACRPGEPFQGVVHAVAARRALPDHPGGPRGGAADAVRAPVGDGRVCQLPGHPDLHGAGAGAAGRAVARLSAGRRGARADGALPEDHQGGPRPAGVDLRARRPDRRRRHRRADRRGQGRAAVLDARPRRARRAVHARHPHADRPVRPRVRAGRADGVADDRQARGRHHRHPLQQDPRVDRAGRRQRRHRGLRRHGRLRDDRPDDDQRQERRPHPDLHLPGGVFLMVLCIAFGPIVSDIPMAALVAVMILVAFGTFDWHSVAPGTLRRMPAGETIVMAVTVVTVVATHNLAIGVVAGSITAMVIFARRVARLVNVSAVTDPEGNQVVYAVTGELFFASSNDLVYQFDYAGDPDHVVIDLTDAHIWDASTVAALDAITTKYEKRGKKVEIVGLNRDSARMHNALSGELAGSH